jgi:acyl-CoA thioester hydrolase
METPAAVFSLAIDVKPEDMDALGHVNNVVYLQWVQEAAAAHWEALASEAVKNRVRWVVLRHEIDYKVPVLPQDSIEVRTWVSGVDGVKSERRVQIWLQPSGKLAAEARTQWCLLDAITLKPKRIDDEIRQLFGYYTPQG